MEASHIKMQIREDWLKLGFTRIWPDFSSDNNVLLGVHAGEGVVARVLVDQGDVVRNLALQVEHGGVSALLYTEQHDHCSFKISVINQWEPSVPLSTNNDPIIFKKIAF